MSGWTCSAEGTCACTSRSTEETCDGRDEDCDGRIDEAACDCSRAESCNMIDDDCDGAIDEAACECSRTESCNMIDDDCDGAVDEEVAAPLCAPRFECSAGECRCSAELRPPTDELDLLLMIDNSSSMGEEQASLAAELPRMMQILANGDRDLDGVMDFVPVRSLHVGVVTSDMGTANYLLPGCDRGALGLRHGDDGILVTRGSSEIRGCMATYPTIFQFLRGGDSGRFARDLACVTTTGTLGCGFEQQLEAVLKGLSPSRPQSWTVPAYQPPIFFGDTLGHASDANAGLVRDSSALAIMMFTDEEDCSVADPELFDAESPRFSDDLNLRCFRHPEAVHPIERYIRGTDARSGLLGLRRRPDRLIFSLVAGIPLDAIDDPRSPDYESVLSHPGMQERIDPTGFQLEASCDVPGRGLAFPPRRMVRTAQALEEGGARVSIGSICQADYGDALDALIDDVAASFTAPQRCDP